MRDTVTDCLGVPLAACVWGTSQADHAEPSVVVALHGWQDNAASFSALGEALEQQADPHWQLHALDLPGHGWSGHFSPAQFYNLWDYVPVVVAYLEAQRRPVWLCGHSLGGMIATLTAAVRPDLVAGLTTLDMLGLAVDPSSRQIDRLIDVLAAQTRPVVQSRPSPDMDHALERRWRFGSPASREANKRLVCRGTRKTERGIEFRLDTRVRHGSVLRLTEDQAVALCRRVACPWQAILGETGMFAEAAVARIMAQLPDVQVTRWPGAHHFHMESDSPPALWQQIINHGAQ